VALAAAGGAVAGGAITAAAVAALVASNWKSFTGQPVDPADLLAPAPEPEPPAAPGETSSTRPQSVARADLDGMQFCLVPAGIFWMGSPDTDKDASDSEKPLHQVDVRAAYWIGQTAVTTDQFAAFVRATGHVTTAEKEGTGRAWTSKTWETVRGADWRHPSGPGSASQSNHPVTQVSWRDAVAFCDWLTGQWRARGLLPRGWCARLPTEREWEKAARGGVLIPSPALIRPAGAGLTPIPALSLQDNPLKARRYPWGDEAPDRSRCNFDMNVGGTTPVGQYSPRGDSPYGCVDMAGNTWDWCATKWQEDYRNYRDDNQTSGYESRVLRGGAFYGDHWGARCAYRHWYGPDGRLDDGGFRVVVSPILF
jgi:formylglycine-generating enzyme required for sulfatase activity